MSDPRNQLTPADREFLRRPLHGFLSVAASATPPQPRPVWFELADDDTIGVFSAPDSARVRHLRRDPRASMVVAAPVGESERWIAVAGSVRIEDAGARELCERLGARYWDLGDSGRADALAEMLDQQWVRLSIDVTRVFRQSY